MTAIAGERRTLSQPFALAVSHIDFACEENWSVQRCFLQSTIALPTLFPPSDLLYADFTLISEGDQSVN